MSSLTPTHRSRLDIQPEVCELCGSLTGVVNLVVPDVQGLRGRRVCERHGSLPYTPSAIDFQIFAPLEIPELIERETPIGGPQWWEGHADNPDGLNDP